MVLGFRDTGRPGQVTLQSLLGAAIPDEQASSPHGNQKRHGRRRWLLWSAAVGLLVAGGIVALVVLMWPRIVLKAGQSELASLSERGGVQIASIWATDGGHAVALVEHGSNLSPVSPVPPGGTVVVNVVARTPRWISWLAGNEVRAAVSVPVPTSAALASPVAAARPGHRVVARFATSVRLVDWSAGGANHQIDLPTPSRSVQLPIVLATDSTGITEISASRYTWEAPGSPVALPYFASRGLVAIVTPTVGTTVLSPQAPLRIFLSRPVAAAFGQRLPSLDVAKLHTGPSGHWVQPNPYTLEFEPAAGSLWPGQQLKITLPGPVEIASGGKLIQTSTITYTMPRGSQTRLQQLLAALDYLPFNWMPSSPTQGTVVSVGEQVALAYSPPAGNFSWRWAPPARLAALWSPGVDNVMTQGAVKAFENVAGLDPVGQANPLLWPYLTNAVNAGKVNPYGYNWADVSKALPEHIVLYHNGTVALQALVNTGIPLDPTVDGTYPVYLRYRSQTMRGTNPNGTHYADFVRWVSYFNGGNAVHGFVRASYGFPQSLGCVELPFATAQLAWPYLHIGTLVTVHS